MNAPRMHTGLSLCQAQLAGLWRRAYVLVRSVDLTVFLIEEGSLAGENGASMLSHPVAT